MWPNYRKGIKVGAITTFGVASLWFGYCYFLSTLPVITDVSLALAFQPWQDNWKLSLVMGLIPGSIAGLVGTFRPVINTKKEPKDLSL